MVGPGAVMGRTQKVVVCGARKAAVTSLWDTGQERAVTNLNFIPYLTIQNKIIR